MKEIFRLDVAQLRIFPMDRIPFDKLGTPSVLAAFRDSFKWAKITPTGQTDAAFEGGISSVEGRDPVQIIRLELNPQRLQIMVRGDSAAADLAFREVSRFWEGVDKSWRGTEPVILTQETSAIVRLDFEWKALFSSNLIAFLEREATKQAATFHPAAAELRRFNLSFSFSYDQFPPPIAAHGISPAEGLVTIEPRVNTPLAERIYFTHSPTDSETHLRLLKELEKELALPRVPYRPRPRA